MLIEKLKSKETRIGIVGLGYVGLPLAIEFALSHFTVAGFEIDRKKIAAINAGKSYIDDITSEDVSSCVRAKKLCAYGDFSHIKTMDAVIICVPTPLRKTKDPDISYIVSAVEKIAPYMKKGQLIILESTTYPGTTREIVLPMLSQKGKKVGKDFFLAFSPERVDPGNKKYGIANTPKVVGGITPACSQLACALYETIVNHVVKVSSAEVAEMVKLLENTFRAVNIGLVNEVALMCDALGLDAWEVIDAASSKPFGFMPFYPGPGIGGHCLATNEMVVIKDNEGPRVCTIGSFIDNLEKSNSLLKHTVGNTTLIKPRDIQTLSFDMEKKTLTYKNISMVSKSCFNGDMKKITTKDGRSLTVTDKHPMVLFTKDGNCSVKFADEIQQNDLLIYIPSIEKQDSFATVEVKRIETMPGGTSYSLEVADTHTFVTSYGIITHNCIPLDPQYLSWKLKMLNFYARFIELAVDINSKMPGYLVRKVSDSLNNVKKPLNGSRVLVLGVAYKKDVGDVRESPALDVIELLKRKGAIVSYHDPYISFIDVHGERMKSSALTSNRIAQQDCIVITTHHSVFDIPAIVRTAKLIVDARNATKGINSKNIVKL